MNNSDVATATGSARAEALAGDIERLGRAAAPSPPEHRAGDLRPAGGHRSNPNCAAERRPCAADRRAGPGEDANSSRPCMWCWDSRSAACSAHPTSCPPISWVPRCWRRRNRGGGASASFPARSSASCSWPMRSTAPARAPNRPCSRRCRSAGSPSPAAPILCPSPSMWWRPRIRWSRREPILCPRPSSTASCCRSTSAIPISRPSARC